MKKMSKWNLLLLLVVVVFCITGCGKEKLSIEEFFETSISGYNGYGEIKIEIDDEGINGLVPQEKVTEYIRNFSKGDTFALWYGTDFSNLIDLVVKEDAKNLSNEDTLTIQLVISSAVADYGETMESLQEALGIEFKKTEFTLRVEGLEDVKILDVMSFVDDYIVYTGANGGASARVEFPYEFTYEEAGFVIARNGYLNDRLEVVKDHESIATITYICEDRKKLSEGEDLNVRVECISPVLGDTGYILNTKKKVKVPDLGEYISTKELLNQEAKEFFDATIMEALDGCIDVSIDKYFWGTLKASQTTDNMTRDGGRLFALVQYKYSLLGITTSTYYKVYEAKEFIARPDGIYELDLSNYSVGAGDKITDDKYDLEELRFQE